MIDLLLLLMAVIWGTNYSIVKAAFAEIDPQAFNGLRMTLASLVFLAVIVAARLRDRGTGPAPSGLRAIFLTRNVLTSRERLALVALGLVGQCVYQYCFIAGLARTSVANGALLIGMTPVLVAVISAGLRLERIGPLHWLGAGLSLAGIYLVVGHGLSIGSHSATGDLLMLVAVVCWAVYTIGARPLMVRHSPVGVTGLSMMAGTVAYVPLTWPSLRTVEWASVSATTWASLVYSAVFSLCVAYTIWYAGVQKLGTARTSVYSNLVPIVAMVTAVLVLHEPISGVKLVGAAAVIGGVGLTRLRG